MTGPNNARDVMNSQAQELLALESEFLAGIEANLNQARAGELPGQIFRMAHFDEADKLKSLLAAGGKYDRQLLKRLPRNRRVELYGYRRRWWLPGKKRVSVTIASVISPLQELIDNPDQSSLPPAGLAQLTEHVRHLVTDTKCYHLIAVCSTAGFTDEAKRARLELPNAAVVLVEPDTPGTWRIIDTTGQAGRLAGLFDPENISQKLARVRSHIAAGSAELLSSGLSVSAVAGRLNLPPQLIDRAFQQAARQDPQLHVTKQAGETILFRGVATNQETAPMSMIDRIRQLFSREGDEAKKINMLTERRTALAQRRDSIYQDIAQLENKEAELKQEGVDNASVVVRRRLAAQLAQLRRDIGRHNTTANMLNQQINIINTHIHNLTLIQQGQAASLPTSEELTADAVRAEEMVEQLRADAELVSSLETDVAETVMSDEEKQILEEFAQAAQVQAETAAAEPAAPAAQTEQQQPPKEKEEQPPEPEA